MKSFLNHQLFPQKSSRHVAQGFVEYALVLASVTIFFMIGQDALLGALKDLFYVAAAAGEFDVQSSGFKVLCVTGERPKANIPGNPDNITRVEFYVDGTLFSTDTSEPKYCMNGENGQQCAKYDIPSDATVKMVAYNTEGRTGQCSRTMP